MPKKWGIIREKYIHACDKWLVIFAKFVSSMLPRSFPCVSCCCCCGCCSCVFAEACREVAVFSLIGLVCPRDFVQLSALEVVRIRFIVLGADDVYEPLFFVFLVPSSGLCHPVLRREWEPHGHGRVAARAERTSELLPVVLFLQVAEDPALLLLLQPFEKSFLSVLLRIVVLLGLLAGDLSWDVLHVPVVLSSLRVPRVVLLGDSGPISNEDLVGVGVGVDLPARHVEVERSDVVGKGVVWRLYDRRRRRRPGNNPSLWRRAYLWRRRSGRDVSWWRWRPGRNAHRRAAV
jgi:hypothetical protein